MGARAVEARGVVETAAVAMAVAREVEAMAVAGRVEARVAERDVAAVEVEAMVAVD